MLSDPLFCQKFYADQESVPWVENELIKKYRQKCKGHFSAHFTRGFSIAYYYVVLSRRLYIIKERYTKWVSYLYHQVYLLFIWFLEYKNRKKEKCEFDSKKRNWS